LTGVSLFRPRNVFDIGFPDLEERQMDRDTPELFAGEISAAFLYTAQGLRRTVETARIKEATR
jgi:hypothetical protein